MRPPIDLPVIILTGAALVLAVIAYLKDPGLPMLGAQTGFAYMTSWSLFGMQRIIAWEAPLMGWPFVGVRVVSSLVFPFLAGWIVQMLQPD